MTHLHDNEPGHLWFKETNADYLLNEPREQNYKYDLPRNAFEHVACILAVISFFNMKQSPWMRNANFTYYLCTKGKSASTWMC